MARGGSIRLGAPEHRFGQSPRGQSVKLGSEEEGGRGVAELECAEHLQQ